MKRIIMLVCTISIAVAAVASADQQVGQVVALKGKATITRGGKAAEARLKSGIELSDTVSTLAGSRAKLLFIDESVLTLGDNTSMVVSDFVHSKSDRGKSMFNLLDGKMRAVVGKTKFEVKTPSAVAAARGTVIYFEVGMESGKHYTKFICLEGVVEVRGLVAGDTAVVQLKPGMMLVIMEGAKVNLPVPASPADIERSKRETTVKGSEISLPPPKLPTVVSSGVFDVSVPSVVPIQGQQVPPVTVSPQQTQGAPSGVLINVNF